MKQVKADTEKQYFPACYDLSQRLFNANVRKVKFLPQNAPETIWRPGSGSLQRSQTL